MSHSLHVPDPSGSFARYRTGQVPMSASESLAAVTDNAGELTRRFLWSSMAMASGSLSLIWLARWAQHAAETSPNQSLGVAALNQAAMFICLGVLTKPSQKAARFACAGAAMVGLVTAGMVLLVS
ncbi:MAG: hypothetical protein M3081_16700 [Gemmatimonadota bacterium]|nr:hypothetical protein [Gemmatimonadota bacterium]